MSADRSGAHAAGRVSERLAFGRAEKPGGGKGEAMRPVLLTALYLTANCLVLASDCNKNGVEDRTDISRGTSKDCNKNRIPDECDVAVGGLRFESADYFPGWPWGSKLEAADFDGDGHVDLAVSDSPGDPPSVSVLLNNGDATFQAPVRSQAPSHCADLVAADFDGDGDIDLAGPFGEVDVLLNRGDGKFPTHVGSPGSGTYWKGSPVPVDIDGDGDVDLVAPTADPNSVGSNAAQVSVFINRGDARFESPKHYPAEWSAGVVVAADFDQDGDSDVALTNYHATNGTPIVSVFLNKGSGALAPRVDHVIGGTCWCTPSAIVASDLDGDGDADIAVVDPNASAMCILLNPGNGAFRRGQGFSAGAGGGSLAAADFDGDGDADLALGDAGIAIFSNEGDATFSTPLQLEKGASQVRSVLARDLDGDGDLDVVAMENESAVVAVLLNDSGPNPDVDGNGVPDECDPDCNGNRIPDGHDIGTGTSIDCNGNGIPDECEITQGTAKDCDKNGIPDGCDIAAGRSQDCNRNGIPDACDLQPSRYGVLSTAVGYAAGPKPMALVLGDIDGDEDLDIATANSGDQTVSILRNSGDGTFVAAGAVPVGGTPSAIVAGDLDGDGDVDVAVANQKSLTVSVLINSGDGEFSGPTDFALDPFPDLMGAGPVGLALSDLDGDGDLDLLVPNRGEVLSLLLNRGNGTFDLRRAPWMFGEWFHLSAVGADFDGDGRSEIIVGAYMQTWSCGQDGCGWQNAAKVALYRNRGPADFYAQDSDRYDTVWRAPTSLAVGDFDKDNDLDLCACGDDVLLFRNNGSATFAAPQSYSVSTGLTGCTSADLDVDGYLDLALVDSITKRVFLLLNDRTGGFRNALIVAFQGSGVPNAIVSGDLDGDRVPDLAVTSRSANSVFVLLNRPDPASRLSQDRDGNGIPDECDGQPRFRRGDTNEDGRMDIADAIRTLGYLFSGEPCSCLKSADANDSGQVDIADGIYVLNYLFASGDAPPVPFEACGHDPSDDGLSCDSFKPCDGGE